MSFEELKTEKACSPGAFGVYVNARFLTQATTGVQRYANEVAVRLQSLCPGIIFLVPSGLNGLHPHASQLNLKTIGRYQGQLWEQWELPLFLRGKRCLLINLCNSAPAFVPRNVQQIATIHDAALYACPGDFSFRYKIFHRALLRRLKQSIDQVVTVSEFSKREISTHLNIDAEKIKVIGGGVDRFNGEYNTPLPEPLANNPFILAVGSPSPRKNLGVLIEAFKNFSSSNLYLCLVGRFYKSLKLRKDIRDILAGSPKVIFLDFADDSMLAKLYKECSAFVYPSLYEGFGLPPLESALYGTRPIVSDIPVHREVCGEFASYFNPASSHELTQLLQEQLVSSNKCDSKSSLQAKYDWDKQAQKWADLIEEIVGESCISS